MPDVVRAIDSEDAEAIWSLLRQFAVSYPPNRAAFESSFQTLLGEDRVVFLVVEDDQVVCGYLIGHVLPTLFANGPIFEIVELIVEETRRKNGLGRKLVAAALSQAREAGCVEAVVPTRRAGPFYERLGFVRTADYFKLKFDP